eukprot:Blabericola_migrator_1__5617@NODE_2858_length_2274_cov_82_594472_g1794_i0_p2_GENE_NODE_2858_length_2274_cov_82_594472_g1794_i0NODE_2858_length_2274_cov_82_594472_g1794_i0_p2_ORF_typecomplete_len186_score19_80SET/PF00856_28/2_9e11SET/PF00856_28/1_5e03_NODE_2858_length_2274_cov_82_594472_g1794_i05701127
MDVVTIYKHAVRINHSCNPNLVCNSNNGVLVYVAVRDIEKDEELTTSYISDLYAPRHERQRRLLKDRLFHCRCARCCETADRDPLRIVKCPAQCTAEAVAVYDGAKKAKEGPWYCASCGSSFPETVVPVQLESTLASSCAKLSTTSFIGKPNEWIQKVLYLYNTCQLSLPKSHFVMTHCYKLCSR